MRSATAIREIMAKILLIEDNEMNRDMLRGGCEEGLHCRIAVDGEGAWRRPEPKRRISSSWT